MKDIILASASPRRMDLLRQVGLKFRVEPSNVDEKNNMGCSAEELVKKLSYEKALSIAKSIETDSMVIGADTVVFRGNILGKPEDKIQAYEMLKSLQGEWHEVITGLSVIECTSMKNITCCEITRVKMRAMTDRLIKAYIDTGEPMDKAGAYGIQGFGALLVEKIEGCYFNVVGLPLQKLSVVLEEFGVKIL
ncbi:MAG TPA: Maf family protein [Clostridia bacterium]|nr:Maf family protein [Clostridia bacterium]